MDELSLPRLFTGFAAAYQGLGLRQKDTPARFATAELSWWARLGHQLGYWPYQDFAYRKDGHNATLLWYPEEAAWNSPLLHWERQPGFDGFNDMLYDRLLPAGPPNNARYCVGVCEGAPADPALLVAARIRAKRALEAQVGCEALLLILFGPQRLKDSKGAPGGIRRWPVFGWYFEAGGHEAVFHAEARIDRRFYRIVEVD